MAVDDTVVPPFLASCGYVLDPVADTRAAFDYLQARYSQRTPRPYATGGDLPVVHPAHVTASRSRHEFVCTYCERGQCARCNDRACTCCYGNEDR